MVAIMLYTAKLSFILIKATTEPSMDCCEDIELVHEGEQSEAGHSNFAP